MSDRVCVVGAGSSGIVAAKVLQERGIPFDAFEMGSGVGGLWRYGNDSGRSVAYASLTANTSRERTGYRCFPISDDWPDYPHHSQLLRYLEAFTDHFGLGERIAFRTRVVRVAPRAEPAGAPADPPAGEGRHTKPAKRPPSAIGSWEVTVRDLDGGRERTARYGAVLVASGHHWKPRCPELPGHFDGLQLHSSRYRTPEILEGRRVLVVGIGNSACDIACEAARVARRTLLSTRRGAHVLPKYLLGRPLDRWMGPLSARLPFAVQRVFFRLLLRLGGRDSETAGVPAPPYPLGSEHPTISQDLPGLVREGTIALKPDVARLAGERVAFVDGSEETLDVVVFATGYDVAFPFLEDGAVRVEGNRVPLFLHVVPPDRPGLYFLGLIQPLGAIPPLAEAQAEWVADLLEGRAALPPPGAMRQAIGETERRLRDRYWQSRRHTMEVDFFPYLRAVERERKRGRRRVRRAEPSPPPCTRPRSPPAPARRGR